MYLRLEFENSTIITSDIYVPSAKETKVLYNNLKYAENSFKINVPWNETLADLLKMDSDSNVKAWIKKDDNTNYFSGYLRKNYGFSKAYRNKPISLELVSPGFFFDKEAREPFHLENKSLKQIVTELLSRTDYKGLLSIDNLEDITIPFFMLEENENIKNVLDQLLFEYGFAYDFDSNGNFYTLNLFPAVPSVITQIFNSQNCYKSIDQTVKENVFKKIVVNWDKIEQKEDVLIFEDSSGATAELAANIELLPGAYFGNEEILYLKYDSSYAGIKWIDSAELFTKFSASGVREQFVNDGLQGELSLYNSTNKSIYINELKIKGNGWFKTTNGNQTFTGETSANKREINTKYIMEEERASFLARSVLNYYRYANFVITLKSSELYEVGTFCKVSDDGIGTVTAKIISRVWNLKSKVYDYTLESVTEYDPAELPQTKTVVPAVAPSASLLQSVLQGVYASHTVELYKRSTTELTAAGITSRLYYDFGKNTIEWEKASGANGWTDDRDSLAGDGNTYVVTATAFGKMQIETVEVNEWSKPVPYGLNGRDGINSYSLQLFIRAETRPNRPAGALQYNFRTAAINGKLEGWERSIPIIDTASSPVWEIHTTVTSSTDIGVISAGQFSEPVIISKDLDISRADIEQMVKDLNMIPTAVVYSDLTFAGIQTNSEGIVAADQTFTANLNVVQGENSLEFTFADVVLPNNYDWSYTTYGKSITIKVNKGARLIGGNIIVKVSFSEIIKTYRYRNGAAVYGYNGKAYGRREYSEVVTTYPVTIGYSFLKGGNRKGPYNRLAQIPFNNLVIGDFFVWTGEDTESARVDGGVFRAGAVYYWDGSLCLLDSDSTHAAVLISDVLEVKSESIKSNNPMIDSLLRKIAANEIITENLFVTGNAWINAIAAKNIKIGDGEGNGSLSAARFEKGLRGWKLDEENAEFNNIVARGTIEAKKFVLLDSAKDDFNNILDSFSVATTEDVTTQLADGLKNYPTRKELENQLSDYASKENLNALGDRMLSDTQIVRYRTNIDSVPAKPAQKVTETKNTVNKTWTRGNLTYSETYKYYYWCYQYVRVDGSVYFSDVYLDQAKIDANSEYFQSKEDKEAFNVLSQTVESKADKKELANLNTDVENLHVTVEKKADSERVNSDIEAVRGEIPTDEEIENLSTVSTVAEISNLLFLVDEDGNTPSEQVVTIPLHAYLGRNKEIALFIRDDLFSSEYFNLHHNGNEAILTVKRGVFITAGSVKIPFNVEKERVWSKPYGNKAAYTNGKGQAYARAEIKYTDKIYFVSVSYTARQGGVYRGDFDSLSWLPSNMLIDDYISWVGSDVKTQINNFPVELIQGRVYRWNGRYYEEDKKTSHFSRSMFDILALNNDILKKNNSNVEEYFKRIVSKQMFTDELVSTDAFIKRLAGDEGFISEFGTKNLRIKEGGSIASDNFTSDSKNPEGFYFGTFGALNGLAILNRAIVRGEIYATGGEFTGKVTATEFVVNPNAKVTGLNIRSVNGLDAELDKKADSSDVYTKTETDAELDKKADKKAIPDVSAMIVKQSKIYTVIERSAYTDSPTPPETYIEEDTTLWKISKPANIGDSYLFSCVQFATKSGAVGHTSVGLDTETVLGDGFLKTDLINVKELVSESAFAEEFGSTRITMKKKGVIQSEGNTEYVYDVYGAVEYSRSGENLYYNYPPKDIYTGRYLQYDMRVTTDRGQHWTIIDKGPFDSLGWYISDVKCDKDNISDELFTYHTHSGGELGWNNYAYHQYIYIRHFQAIEGVTNNYEFQVGQLLDISKRYTLNGNGYASFTNADIKGALDADGGVLYSYYLYAKNFEDIRLFYRCNVQPRLKTNRWVMAGGTMKIQHYELVNGQYKWKDYSFHIVGVRHSEGFFFTIMGFTYDGQYEIQASINEINMEGIDIARVFISPTNGSSGWLSQVIPPDNIGWRMNWLYLLC